MNFSRPELTQPKSAKIEEDMRGVLLRLHFENRGI